MQPVGGFPQVKLKVEAHGAGVKIDGSDRCACERNARQR